MSLSSGSIFLWEYLKFCPHVPSRGLVSNVRLIVTLSDCSADDVKPLPQFGSEGCVLVR